MFKPFWQLLTIITVVVSGACLLAQELTMNVPDQSATSTAEAIYRDDDRVSVRSRGTTKAAVQTVRSSDITWADVILVMEDKHRQRILSAFPGESRFKPVHVLDIPHPYRFMDAELVELIKAATEPIIQNRLDG